MCVAAPPACRAGAPPRWALGFKSSLCAYLHMLPRPWRITRAMAFSSIMLSSGKCKSTYLVLMCLETFFKSLLRQKVVRHFK